MSKYHQLKTWHNLSKQRRKQNPICADPFGYHKLTGSYAIATEVHHIESVESAPERLLDTENLIEVCSLCHNALHLNKDAIMRLIESGVDAGVVAGVVIQAGGENKGMGVK